MSTSTLTRAEREAALVCRRAPNAKMLVIGSVSLTGPIDQEDRILQDASGAETLRRVTVATVPTHELGTVARHTRATVGTTTYTIRDAALLDDGLLTELILAEVPS